MLASNEDKQVQGNRPVMQYLVRECRHCGGIMKVIKANDKIFSLENCTNTQVFRPRVDKVTGKTILFFNSQKVVRCSNRRKGNPLAICNRMANLCRFQEITP